MLELDAVLFEQVLFNLLDNAAKYAPADTTISIRSWRDQDQCRLQVIDEGDGIPPADLESIFDKFYRAQKGDHVRAGTGLGLAISRGFVEAMHGTITAANRTDRSGRGVHHPAAGPGRHRRVGYRRMNAAPIKVLVVDDEPPIRKLLRMGLSTQGYEILEAPNGKTALELLAEEPGAGHPRSRPAGHPGPRIAAHDPRPQRQRADRRAVEPRRRGRQGAGARSRRRRLS